MKRIIAIYLGLIFLCFLLPVLLTKVIETNNEEQLDNEKMHEEKISPPHVVKLFHTANNQIEELDLEEYIYGVVSAEMPANFEKEALKAQAIVARTYTLYKEENDAGKHGQACICDDPVCCQAWISKEDRLSRWDETMRNEYWNKIVSAVDETKGQIITYDGKPINAFFHSNSGGSTEAPIDVWGGSGYPYLQTVATAGEDAYGQYASEVSLTKMQVLEKLKEKHPEAEIDFTKNDWTYVKEYTNGGRVRTIQMGNISLSGVEARIIFGLKSANFSIETEGDNICFKVIGYGHGVGMSQTGADSLAKNGKNAEEIIHHFYTGVEIQNLI